MILKERLLTNDDFFKVSDFECGIENEPLNNYLKIDSFQDMTSNRSRIYIIEEELSKKIVGYYSIRTNGIIYIDRNNYDKNISIPVMEISEFAIDIDFQGKGIGTGIFHTCILLKSDILLSIIGLQAILVYAFHERAIEFYKKLGFQKLEKEDGFIILEDDFSKGCQAFIFSLSDLNLTHR